MTTIFILLNNEEGVTTPVGTFSTMERAKAAANGYRAHWGYDPVEGWVQTTEQDWIDEAGAGGDDYHMSIAARPLDA